MISFHNYAPPKNFEKHVRWLQAYHRPLLCTEYMARPTGSTFTAILPLAKKEKVAALNWGFVAGKTQTWLPWNSWKKLYTNRQPSIWFHDVFHADGTPYLPSEVHFIRTLTGASAGFSPGKAIHRCGFRRRLFRCKLIRFAVWAAAF